MSERDEAEERAARERETNPSFGRVPDTEDGEPAAKVAGRSTKTRILRWGLRVLLLLLVLAFAAVAVVYVYWDDILRRRIAAVAEAEGVSLSYEAVTVRGIFPWQSGPAEASLDGVTLALLEQPQVVTKAKNVHVALEGLAPKRVSVVGPTVEAPTLADVLLVEEALTARRKSDKPLPEVHVEDAKLVVARALGNALPWKMAVLVKSIRVDQPIVALEALSITVTTDTKKKYGPFIVDISLSESEVAVAVSKIAAKIIVLRDLSKVSVGLDRFGVEDARRALGAVSLDASWLEGIPTFSITGKLDAPLAWPPSAKGKVDVELPGFVPPHPRELNGIVFGKTTYASATLDITERGATGDVTVKNGALSVKGKLDATLVEPKVKLELSGSLNCSELAASAVGAHLGFGASLIVGELARQRLGGTVFVTIKAEASAKEAWKPKVIPSANVRCSVRL